MLAIYKTTLDLFNTCSSLSKESLYSYLESVSVKRLLQDFVKSLNIKGINMIKKSELQDLISQIRYMTVSDIMNGKNIVLAKQFEEKLGNNKEINKLNELDEISDD